MTTITVPRDVATISKRNLLRVARTPRLLIVSAVPPVLFVVLFRYVFGGAIHTPGANYADYLLPTILILTQLLGATTAVALATDLAGGMVDRFRSLAVGFRFHNGFWLGLAGLALVLAFSYAMSWEMCWIALKLKDPETAQVAGFLPSCRSCSPARGSSRSSRCRTGSRASRITSRSA